MYPQTLQRLQQNLNILREREAKYAGSAPPELLNQIADHEQAIELTGQASAGELGEAAWREALRPLLVEIEKRTGEAAAINISDIADSVVNIGGSVMANIDAGGDVVGGDKIEQTAHGSNIAQASHGGQATVNVTDQRDQQVFGDQFNAGRDIHIHGHAPLSTRQRGGYAIAGIVLGLVVNVAINLLSSGLEQQFFGRGITVQSLWGLGLFALVGGLLGLWLSGPAKVPASTVLPVQSVKPVTVTRLRALFSYTKVRGKGISLSDILLIGSKLDIDARSNDDPSDH